MLTYREGESRPYPFRSGRFFNVNGEWFFSTREGATFGPYAERSRAEEACTTFLNRQQMERQRKRHAG